MVPPRKGEAPEDPSKGRKNGEHEPIGKYAKRRAAE